MSVSTRFTVPMPKIGSVRADGLYFLEVDWAVGPRAGISDRIDVSSVIKSYKIFSPLVNNRHLFQIARPSEYGTAVQWGDNEDLAISALALERLVEESMTAEQFREFLRTYKLTHGAAAIELGRSRRQIEHYLSGRRIPRVVVLACYGYVARLHGMRSLLRPNQRPIVPLHIITETRGRKPADKSPSPILETSAV